MPLLATLLLPLALVPQNAHTRFDPIVLDLDGHGYQTLLENVRGGYETREVVEEDEPGAQYTRKHIGNVKYEEISFRCGAGMSKTFFDWLQESFNGRHTRKSGAIIACDFNYKEKARRTFTEALISEVGFPALDAASKDAGKMTVKIQPEFVKSQVAPGPRLDPSRVKPAEKIDWDTSSFRFTVDGLEKACASIARVGRVKVKFPWLDHGDPAGAKEPTKIEFPDLKFTLPEVTAKPFYDWYEDFVIKGNNGQEMEKTGSLEYVTSAGILRLDFRGLGIIAVTPEDDEPGNGIKKVKVELYVEEMRFSYKGSWQ